jgi:DGQHR domain-containing protein
MSNLQIKCLPFTQNGETAYISSVKAKDLVGRFKVDEWSPTNTEGYQRKFSERRGKEFASFMANGGFCPTTMLLNLRVDKDQVQYKYGNLVVPDETTFWLTDGQHRLGGLSQALEDNPKLADIEFPVVITCTGGDALKSRYNEAKQFVIINRTQKGIRADLAERFLQNAVQMEGMLNLVKQRDSGILRSIWREIEWRPKAVTIVTKLNELPSSIWYSHIRMPNQPKGNSTVSEKSFTDSLEPILTGDKFSTTPADKLVAVIDNYWKAIGDACPSSFSNPEDSVILKTTGVFVLHDVFLTLADYTKDEKGRFIFTKEKFAGIIERVKGYFEDSFWNSEGTAGVMGTGQKSFRAIAKMIKEGLESSLEIIPEDTTRIVV